MNNADMMGIGQNLGAILAQAQTNFNGLVQLAEAETNFQKEVYKQLKQINDTLKTVLDKIDPPITDTIETASVKTSKK